MASIHHPKVGKGGAGKEKAFKDKLSASEYLVLRECGTEPPFSGALLHNKAKGTYGCKACGNVLFDSSTKFDSGSGWPSFYDARKGAVTFLKDGSFGMERVEVRCAKCGSHLGHVFDDGPGPTGKRYCINSVALGFKARGRA